MSWVKDNFFGGAAKDAAKQQVAATEKASGITQQAYNQARSDILNLFPASYQQLAQGYQQAADVIGQGRASSQQVLQQSFGNANQTLQSGNQAIIDALLGRQSQPFQQQAQPQPQQVQPQPQTPPMTQQPAPGAQPIAAHNPAVVNQPRPSVGVGGRLPDNTFRPQQTAPVSLPQESIDPVTGRPVDQIMQTQSMMQPTGLRGNANPANPTGWQVQTDAQPDRIAPVDTTQQQAGDLIDTSVRGGDRVPIFGGGPAMDNLTVNPTTGQVQVTGANPLPAATPQQAQQMNVGQINPADLGAPQIVQGGDFSGIGLSGAESALQAALQGQIGAYQQGLQGQLGTLLDATNQAQGGLRQGLEGQLGAYNQAQQGATGAINQGLQSQLGIFGQGLESATGSLNQAMQGQLGSLQQGSQQATGTLRDAAQGQLSSLGQGFGAAQGQLADMYGQQTGALQQGAVGAENALTGFSGAALGELQSGLRQGLGVLGQGQAQAQGAINQAAATALQGGQQAAGRIDAATGQAVNFLNPYSQAGQQALNQEAALSGALGAEAQQQAINNFIESPGQKFLRERQEQALLRNQAAVGGLRGGATLTALQEQAMGIAATQQQQQLENLRNLAGRGQQAAGQQGQFTQQGGIASGSAIQNAAGQAAGLQGQMAGISAALAGQGAGMANQAGQAGAGIMQGTGQGIAGLRQGLGQNLSNVAGTYGQNAANMSATQGQLGANVLGQTGQNIAGMQNQLGQNQAGVIGNTGQQVAGLQGQFAQLGGNAAANAAQQNAGIIGQFGQLGGAAQGQYGQNIANLFGTMGQAGANAIGQNAQLAGNAFGQSGQQLSGLRQQAGQQVAQQLGATTNNLANNQMQLGQLLAGLDQQTAANLSNLLTGGATVGSQNHMQLAQLLANLATGQGTTLANLAVEKGNAQAAGLMGPTNAIRDTTGMIAQALATYYGGSDIKLKENIIKIVDGAVSLYVWTWKHIKDIPANMRGKVSYGVMAQEVAHTHPDCVVHNGKYYLVNYKLLSERVKNAS